MNSAERRKEPVGSVLLESNRTRKMNSTEIPLADFVTEGIEHYPHDLTKNQRHNVFLFLNSAHPTDKDVPFVREIFLKICEKFG
jgi:hypothetical protein